jgi:hypothetical protein
MGGMRWDHERRRDKVRGTPQKQREGYIGGYVLVSELDPMVQYLEQAGLGDAIKVVIARARLASGRTDVLTDSELETVLIDAPPSLLSEIAASSDAVRGSAVRLLRSAAEGAASHRSGEGPATS